MIGSLNRRERRASLKGAFVLSLQLWYGFTEAEAESAWRAWCARAKA